MDVFQISAITLKVKDMSKSTMFYSNIPGLALCYGGSVNDRFTSFEIVDGNYKTYINLELADEEKFIEANFGRIIFYTDDVDKLYSTLRANKKLSSFVSFENEPHDATWGERYFHMRDPDGYQLSFATPCIG